MSPTLEFAGGAAYGPFFFVTVNNVFVTSDATVGDALF